jgi:hypothetical protein
MKTENILIFGGLAFIAYHLFKKTKEVIDVNPVMETKKVEEVQPKTIVLDLNPQRRGLFPDAMYRGYNSSKMATVAPAKVNVF